MTIVGEEKDAALRAEESAPGPFSPIRTQRTLQIILGLLWILDAALQYQPYMFGKDFVPTFVTANASGQPEPLGWLITTAGHFISPDVAVWNTIFATIQLVIGAGLLYRRTVRPALAISIVWALSVWIFGEGLGMILTGTATALTGAPGSVFMYGAVALMAWPRIKVRKDDRVDSGVEVTGIASSPAAQGLGGVITPLVVWSGYWILAALLFVFPANRTQTSISSAITGMAPGTPEWYSHFLTSFGHAFSSVGTQSAWVLAIVSLVIGLGPLVVWRPGIFLAAGGLLSVLMWVTGQGFLGGVLTGSGTDPNTGPLVVLLALAMTPTVLSLSPTWRSPIAALLSYRPAAVLGGGTAILCALILAGTYPAAAQESSSTSMSGMSMSGSSGTSGMSMSGSGTESEGTASCTKGNNGVARSGLDVTNTPNMVMGRGGVGMNMNGADATAAAGLNATKVNWSYTGPALPTALSRELLAQGNNGPDQIHMAATGCVAEPTFSEQIGATQYVQATTLAVAPYSSPALAVAAGYVAVSPTDYPVVYYVNPTIVAANAVAKRTLNPQFVDGLIYAETPSGTQVLAAALYLLPATVHKAPMPYGPLVQWHQRTDVCGPTTASASSPLLISGVTPCSSGSVQRATPYLTMVWQVPVAGGPLAIQPPDIQIVEAAVMAEAAKG
jgi:hypothetical protein